MRHLYKIAGVYKIQSINKTERIYIGSAINISERWSRHLTALKLNKHENKKLQNHYNKYGKNDLQFSIIIGCAKDDLLTIEQFYIDSYNPYFNICKIAGRMNGFTGHHTLESNRKNSESNKGRAPWNKGLKNIYSEETIQKMSKGRKGKTHSEDTKKIMSDKKMGNDNGKYLKGVKYSEERKQQCRDVWVKRKLSKIEMN